MTETLYALIARLADGDFHSGEALAKEVGVSRSAVWNALQQLPALGVELYAVHGRGYRLAVPLELLDEARIRAQLKKKSQQYLGLIEILPTVDSTSSYLKQAAAQGAPSGTVAFAEFQSAGRGRRGRSWHSPYGANLYLSLLWRFDEGMNRLGGLSLAAAVALMRCFTGLGASGLGIKWPNDIVAEEGKLAGILVDVAGESSGPCHAVIGIGINYAMPISGAETIDQPWTTLLQHSVNEGRNAVAAALLDHIIDMLLSYQQEGFEPFVSEWSNFDMLRDQAVTVHTATENVAGIARGIDQNGLLLVEQAGEQHSYAAGDVSLRRRYK